jgi:hypothetical protein
MSWWRLPNDRYVSTDVQYRNMWISEVLKRFLEAKRYKLYLQVQKVPTQIPVPSHVNPTHTYITLFKVYIYVSTYQLLSGLPRFDTQIAYTFNLTHACYVPTRSHFLSVEIISNIC